MVEPVGYIDTGRVLEDLLSVGILQCVSCGQVGEKWSWRALHQGTKGHSIRHDFIHEESLALHVHGFLAVIIVVLVLESILLDILQLWKITKGILDITELMYKDDSDYNSCTAYSFIFPNLNYFGSQTVRKEHTFDFSVNPRTTASEFQKDDKVSYQCGL